MADVISQLAAYPAPKPLPPGTNDYGPLAYFVWAVGLILLLLCVYFGARALLRLRAGRSRRSHRGTGA